MVIIFDLDGTLLDTVADLGRACNHALEMCGYVPHDAACYPHWVGNGINKLIERALLAQPCQSPSMSHHSFLSAEILRVRAEFVAFYNVHNCDLTTPYDGIPALLSELKERGCRLAVASNKYIQATQRIVTHFFPGMFDVVLGERDGVPRKPHPQIVWDILSGLNSKQSSSDSLFYIGDSLVDVQTAANAGIKMIACSWGFGAKSDLLHSSARFVVDSPQEILRLLSSSET